MTAFLKYCLTPILLMALGCGNANQSGEAAYEGYATPETTMAQKTYEEEIGADMLVEEPRDLSYSEHDDQPTPEPADQEYQPPATNGQEEQAISPKIIYTAQVRMQVDSLDASLATIRELVTASGGYISDQNTANTRYEKSAQLTIRLPTRNLDGSMAALRDLARFVDHERMHSEDVTDQWIDLESRLQTKRDVRDRYIEVLRRRAVKVEDILNAEERIRRITEEIEAQEGRLRYLKNRVSLSTLNLNLYETVEYVSAPTELHYGFGNRLSEAFGSGWSGVRELVLGLVSIWPLLLVLFPLVLWGVRRFRR